LVTVIAARKDLEDGLGDDGEDDEEVEENILNLNDDDEDVWDEDSAYLDLLASEGARLREKSENTENTEEVEDDDSDSDDLEIDEELGYLSPLDNVNPYISFKQALTTFQLQNPAGYEAATVGLDLDQQTLLMDVLRVAEAQATEAAQA